ncbi:MAG TPA: phosphohistidine phosphatase SixA [Ignavibacteria bacterium]
MKIFLVRHGEAIDYETESVKNDANRFITPKGRKVSRNVFKKLRSEFSGLEVIFTSPLTRALQTAEILANSVKFENDVEIANELITPGSVENVTQLIKRNSRYGSLAIVGHEPMMSMLVQALSDRKENLFSFKKSGVCCIDLDTKEQTGKFLWYYDPKLQDFIK